MFTEARLEAVTKLESMKDSNWSAVPNAELADWLVQHAEALKVDIENSQHIWVDSQKSCGRTERKPFANIILSIESCVHQIKTRSDAVKLLVHESVHHFGIESKDFADQVAVVVGNLANPTPEGESSSSKDSISLDSPDCLEQARQFESPSLKGRLLPEGDAYAGYCSYDEFAFTLSTPKSWIKQLKMFMRDSERGHWQPKSDAFINHTQIGIDEWQVIAQSDFVYPSSTGSCPEVQILVVIFEKTCA